MESSFTKELKWLKNYVKIWRECRRTKEGHAFLIGTPVYGNLGDQAITLGEYKFLEDMGYQKKVIEIPSLYIRRHTKMFKRVIGKADIFIQGGGFLGSLWPVEEGMVRSVIKNFPGNKIVIFPQTVYFSDDEEGRRQKNISQEIYGGHKNLSLFLRETKSYELAKNDMKLKNVYLVPDMALMLDSIENEQRERNNILFCLRSDKEKTLSKKQEQMLSEVVGKFFPQDRIIYTDTVSTENVWKNQRKKAVYDKLEEFSKAKMIVTDRLHGMVFAALAGTPCIVVGSCSYKVKGIFDWIKNNPYIVFIDDFNMVKECVEKVASIGDTGCLDKTLLEGRFEELKYCVNGGKTMA